MQNNTQWTNWSKEEFIHSCLIMINYHRLASVCETLHINFYKSKDEIDQLLNNFHKLNIKKTEEQSSLFETISLMNSGKEVSTYSRKKKKSEDVKIEGNILNNISFNLNEIQFTKHINQFCTAYQDFDCYEQELLSALVINLNLFRNLIGLITDTIYLKI